MAQGLKLHDMNSANSSTQMGPFSKNCLESQRDLPNEVVSTDFDHMEGIKAHGAVGGSEVQGNSHSEKKRDYHQGDLAYGLKSVSVCRNDNRAEVTEYDSETNVVENIVCSEERETILKMKSNVQEGVLENVEPINITQTECNKLQGREQCLEIQNSVDSEKERETFQGPIIEEVKSTDNDGTEGGEPQGIGHGLELHHSTDKEKKRDSFTENVSRTQGHASVEVETSVAKQNNCKTEKNVKKDVKDKSNVDKKNQTFSSGDAKDRKVNYKEKHARIQVLTLGDSLEAYLPLLKIMILDRKCRYSGLICKLDKLKQCIPTDATQCKCIFLIDLDEQTGKPILGIFTDGKVQKDWEGRQFYHPSILKVAEVFEKLISASEWEVGRGNKGFWRKLHICCNKSGEVVLWILVQSPEGEAKEAIQKLKTLFTEFFEKGEGKKCKIASAHAQITFTCMSGSSNRRISSLTELIMGSEQYEDCILGFKLRMIPRIPTIWGLEQSCMKCQVVKDLLALDDYTTVIIIGLTDFGLLALSLAKDAGEVICVDKIPIIEDVKQNLRLNNLESKCKFYAGFATEEVRKITPRYKKVHAVVMVPTIAKLMALKESKNLSCIRSVILFLESSNISSSPLMTLGDTERGTSFFPSRIIPFDTHPDNKDYMMAIRTEKVDIPKAGTHGKSSSRRSNGSTWSQDHRERDERIRSRRDHSAEERRKRNRMLPDAREVIVARRHNKEKEQLMATSRFRPDERPNLVIEIKKPNFDNYEQRRYVKERTKETADEYEHNIIEKRDLCTKAKQRLQDMLRYSLRQHLPSLDENTAENLKEVITEAIECTGLFDSSHQRNEHSFMLPRVAGYEPENYLKHHQSDDTGQNYHSHISHLNDEIRRNEVTEHDFVNGNFQRQHKDNCEISTVKSSDDCPNSRRKAVQERELLSDGRSVQIDTRETFDRISSCDRQVDRNDTYSQVEASRYRKRGLEIDHSVNQHCTKMRRTQDHSSYKKRYSSLRTNHSNLEAAPYYRTQHGVSEDKDDRNPQETQNSVIEQNRGVTNPVNQIPFSTKDLRNTAEQHNILPQVSFKLFPTGGSPHPRHMPDLQYRNKHLVLESGFSGVPGTSVHENVIAPQLPNIEFRRPPPFMPPHWRNK